MASRTGFRVSGLTAVVRALQDLGLETEDLKDAFSDIAALGARLAAGYAPKLTGRLAGDVRGNRAKSKAVVTAGRVGVPYAGAINYGWAAHNIEPSGFLQRADTAMRPQAIQLLEQDINTKIRQRGIA